MEKTTKQRIALIGICILILAPFYLLSRSLTPKPKEVTKPTYTPQFIIFSFDGSKSIDMWKETRDFEHTMKAAAKPLNFTYFINAAYFLTPDKKDLYQAPRQDRGQSNIGFSEDLGHLRIRILAVNEAVADGDEIASHTAGHYWGGEWSAEEWLKEFRSFNALLFGTDTNYPEAHLPKLNLTQRDIVGFRAPALSIGPTLYIALSLSDFTYDSSEVGNGREWPKKDSTGIWHIPLGTVHLNHGRSPVVAMDYSIRASEKKIVGSDTEIESGEKGDLKKGTPAWNAVYHDVLGSYLDYFEKNYKSNRAPVLIGHHFATWDNFLYWEAMKEFAVQVCGKPEVRCGTFKDLVKYMNDYGVPKK